MAQDQTRELMSGAPSPATAVAADVGTTMPGYQLRYLGGVPVQIPDDRVAEAEAQAGLLRAPLDVQAAVEAVDAHYLGFADAWRRSLEEILSLGYVRAESEDVMQKAWLDLGDACRWALACLSGKLPAETLVRSLAEHKALHGSLDAVPSLRRYEALADAYAAAAPPDRTALAQRAQAGNRQAVAALLERAASLAEDDATKAQIQAAQHVTEGQG